MMSKPALRTPHRRDHVGTAHTDHGVATAGSGPRTHTRTTRPAGPDPDPHTAGSDRTTHGPHTAGRIRTGSGPDHVATDHPHTAGSVYKGRTPHGRLARRWVYIVCSEVILYRSLLAISLRTYTDARRVHPTAFKPQTAPEVFTRTGPHTDIPPESPLTTRTRRLCTVWLTPGPPGPYIAHPLYIHKSQKCRSWGVGAFSGGTVLLFASTGDIHHFKAVNKRGILLGTSIDPF
jgi:hypothetical protein